MSEPLNPPPVRPVVMNELLVGSWQLMQRNWILLTVVMLETLILLLVKGGQVGLSPDVFLEMVLFFFHLAVLGGWLNQIKVILLDPGQRASWDDFFNGVARYFGQMLAGGAMFLFVCLLGFLVATSLAGAFAGVPDTKLVEEISKLVQANKLTELEALMKAKPDLFAQLNRWVGVLMAGLVVLALYCASIAFWTHWTVLGNQTWIASWRSSQKVMRRHWKPMLYLGMLWLVPTALLQGTLLTGLDALVLAGFLLGLLAKTYFTLLFCNFLVKAEPELVAPLPEAPKPPPRL